MSGRREVRQGIMFCAIFGGLLALGTGCATQEWVLNTIRDADKPLETRVGQLEANAGREKARLDQLGGRVDQLASQVSEARRVADGAAQAANEAKQQAAGAAAKADAVDARLTRALANRLKRNPVQQVDVTFATGKSDLPAQAQTALQGVVKLLADNPTYTADVVGYTDFVGDKDYNVDLSWYREESVRRFLVEKGAELNRFSFIGLGEDMATGKDAAGKARDRHVAIKVFRPAD